MTIHDLRPGAANRDISRPLTHHDDLPYLSRREMAVHMAGVAGAALAGVFIGVVLGSIVGFAFGAAWS